MLPLVLNKLSLGQRHYFDCYESAYGGLLAFNYKNYDVIRNLYCIFDSISLSTDEVGSAYLQSRSLDINKFIRELLGYELESFSSLTELKTNKGNIFPFVIDFDEYYILQNNNYKKKHFNHSSLCIEIRDNNNFVVIDPGLEITKPIGYSADERIIEVDDQIYQNQSAIKFSVLKYVDRREQFKQITTAVYNNLENFNLTFWLNKIDNIEKTSDFYFGTRALEYFKNTLDDLTKVKIAATEFYKWIFPFFWKRYYLKQHSNPLAVSLVDLLSIIVKEMEIFETNLLRLTASKSTTLHNAAKKRWDKIIVLIQQYIELEFKRVNAKQ